MCLFIYYFNIKTKNYCAIVLCFWNKRNAIKWKMFNELSTNKNIRIFPLADWMSKLSCIPLVLNEVMNVKICVHYIVRIISPYLCIKLFSIRNSNQQNESFQSQLKRISSIRMNKWKTLLFAMKNIHFIVFTWQKLDTGSWYKCINRHHSPWIMLSWIY